MGLSNKKLARELGCSKKVQREMKKTNDDPPKRGPKANRKPKKKPK